MVGSDELRDDCELWADSVYNIGAVRPVEGRITKTEWIEVTSGCVTDATIGAGGAGTA